MSKNVFKKSVFFLNHPKVFFLNNTKNISGKFEIPSLKNLVGDGF